MKKINMLFFLFFISLNSITNAHSNVYVAGDVGVFKNLDHKRTNGLYGIALGYKFNPKLQAEVLYKNFNNHVIGGALRVTPFSIFSLSGGLLRQLETNSKNDEVGFFIAPGVDLNWLPGNNVLGELDVFSELGYYAIGLKYFVALNIGLRLHF